MKDSQRKAMYAKTKLALPSPDNCVFGKCITCGKVKCNCKVKC